MFVCVRCALIAFVLGILGVVFVWPFLQNWWQGSGSGDSGYSSYDNGYGDNGDYGYDNGSYGGYRGGAAYGAWGGGPPAYAVAARRPRFVPPPPCYRPCY